MLSNKNPLSVVFPKCIITGLKYLYVYPKAVGFKNFTPLDTLIVFDVLPT